MSSLWDILPSELQNLVLQHRAASIIQLAISRDLFYKHSRRKEWPDVRSHFGSSVVRALWPYPMVRREWNMEPLSWLYSDVNSRLLIDETREGLWGSPNSQLARLLEK